MACTDFSCKNIFFSIEEIIAILGTYLYKPIQSPLIPEVSWGPECSKVRRNSSESNGRSRGGPYMYKKI